MNSPKKTYRYEIPNDVRKRLNFTDEQLSELCEAFAVVSRTMEEETDGGSSKGREGGERGGRGGGGRGGGRVSGRQLEMILNTCLAIYPTDEQLRDIERNEGSGELSFDALLRLLCDRDLHSQPEAEFRDAFDLFDRDGDGFLTARDLKQVMSNFGEKMTDAQIEEMVREADLDRDGKISFSEFSRMMSLPVK